MPQIHHQVAHQCWNSIPTKAVNATHHSHHNSIGLSSHLNRNTWSYVLLYVNCIWLIYGSAAKMYGDLGTKREIYIDTGTDLRHRYREPIQRQLPNPTTASQSYDSCPILRQLPNPTTAAFTAKKLPSLKAWVFLRVEWIVPFIKTHEAICSVVQKFTTLTSLTSHTVIGFQGGGWGAALHFLNQSSASNWRKKNLLNPKKVFFRLNFFHFFCKFSLCKFLQIRLMTKVVTLNDYFCKTLRREKNSFSFDGSDETEKRSGVVQGCQIFLGTAYQNGKKLYQLNIQ
jgi:hypothetical protein